MPGRSRAFCEDVPQSNQGGIERRLEDGKLLVNGEPQSNQGGIERFVGGNDRCGQATLAAIEPRWD